jgi:WD40 repeat protein
MTPHPDLVRFQRWLNADLPAEETREIEVHLQECPHCVSAVERLTDLPPDLHLLLSGQSSTGNLSCTPKPEPSPHGAGESRPFPVLPGFELLEELGRGGMGIVYKARQPSLDRLVALKVLREGEHAAPDDVARLRREAEAVARLQHPNIVQIYEIGEQDGRPFLALEFVEGESLARKAAGQPQPVREAAALVAALAEAMHAVHQRGVVHRDLKPANILLQESGVRSQESGIRAERNPGFPECCPKITDFGLARRVDVDLGHTQSGAVVGTPAYMAPEQAAGKGREAGPAADTYALGAILYELLTGRPPFHGVTLLDTLQQVAAQEPVPPSRLQPSVPRDLDTIVLKCLQKQPGKRYGSAGALAEDLRRFLAGEPIQARPSGRWERTVKWARRRPAAAALLAVVSAVVLVGFPGLTALYVRAEGERTAAEQARDLADRREKETDVARRDAVKQKLFADDQKTKAEAAEQRAKAQAALAERQMLRADTARYLSRHIGAAQRALQGNDLVAAEDLLASCSWQLRGWEYRYLWTLYQRRFRLLERDGDQPSTVDWSSDGKCLAGLRDGKPVVLWDVASGRELLSLRGLPGAFSPDGRDLAAAEGRSVTLWDARTGKQRHVLSGHPDKVAGVTYSSDGRRLAVSAGRSLTVWDASTGKQVRVLDGYPDALGSVTFSRDGGRVAVQSGQSVTVWDASSGKQIQVWQGLSRPLGWVTLSPDGQHLAAGEFDPKKTMKVTVRVWSVATGQQVVSQPDRFLNRLVFSPDGRLLLGEQFTDILGSVTVWDVPSGREVMALPRYLNGAFSPNGKWLIACKGPTVTVWEAATGQERFTLRGHRARVNRGAFHPDGRGVASGDHYGIVTIWDEKGQQVRTFRAHRGAIQLLAFSSDGRYLATSADWDGVKIWDLGPWPEAVTLRAHRRWVCSVAVSPDGSRLASAGENLVKLWDRASGKEVVTIQAHTPDPRSELPEDIRLPFRVWDYPSPCVAFSPDGQRLAGRSEFQTLKVWDTAKGTVVLSLKGHALWIGCVAYSPNGKRIVSGSGDFMGGKPGEVKVWDAATGAELFSLPGHKNGVTCVAYSPDGKRIVSGSADRSLKVWDAEKGALLFSLEGHKGGVTCVAFSRDGKHIVSGGGDRTLRVWDAEKGTAVRALVTDQIRCVAFSPDGSRLASGSGDRTLAAAGPGEVTVWDAITWQELLTLGGHTAAVNSVTFSRDGQRLVSGADDGTVKVWEARTEPDLLVGRERYHKASNVAFSPDGKRLAGAWSNGLVKVWDMVTGQETLTIDAPIAGPRWKFTRLAFSPDSRRLVSTWAEWMAVLKEKYGGEVKVWDTSTGKEALAFKIRTFQGGHLNPLQAFSADGRRLACHWKDGTVTLWDVSTGKAAHLLKIDVGYVALSPDGQRLAGVRRGRTVVLWDVATGKELFALESPDQVVCLSFSPDGSSLVAGGDGRLTVWDLAARRPLVLAKAPGQWFSSAAFSPDGKRVVSSSGGLPGKREPGELAVWDLATGRKVVSRRGRTDSILSVAFSPDGRRVASAGDDGAVRLWEVAPAAE